MVRRTKILSRYPLIISVGLLSCGFIGDMAKLYLRHVLFLLHGYTFLERYFLEIVERIPNAERILIYIPYHGIVIIIAILNTITIYIFINVKFATSSKTI